MNFFLASDVSHLPLECEIHLFAGQLRDFSGEQL